LLDALPGEIVSTCAGVFDASPKFVMVVVRGGFSVDGRERHLAD
jgi:hypothetical protein